MKRSFRGLARSPRFTVLATVALGLGIGANTAVFSVADGLLFRPLPFERSAELVSVHATDRVSGASVTGLTMADLADFRAEADLFAAFAGWRLADVTHTGAGDAERLRAAAVTGGMFSRVLRVQPVLGRLFLPEEDRPGGTRAVLLSHDLWATAMGEDRSVLGRAMALDGVPYTIVGVMPEGFVAPFVPDARLWFPAQLEARRCRGCDGLSAVGRLAPGLTVSVAGERALAVSRRLAEAYPVTNTGFELSIIGLAEARSVRASGVVRLLFLASGLILLMACTNVANLFVARGRRMHPDFTLRSALGAAPGSLASTVLIDATLITLAGAVLALMVADWGTAMLLSAAPDGVVVSGIGVDGRVFAFNVLAALAAALACGAWPALRVALRRYGVPRRPSAGGGRRAPLQVGLVVGQVALAMVLTAGAAIVIEGLQELRATDVGFVADGVLAMTLPAGAGTVTVEGDTDWQSELLSRAAGLPGVLATATTTALPLAHEADITDFTVRNRPLPENGEVAEVRRITGSYPYVMGIRLTEGRAFSDEDRSTAVQPVIVNETFARRHLRGSDRSAIGAEIALGRTGSTWRPVIGVLRDVRAAGPRRPPAPAIYLPPGGRSSELSLVLRTDGDPADLAQELREVLAAVAPEVAPRRLAPMTALAAEVVAEDRFVSALLGAFALLALCLAGIGLYGALDQSVVRRRADIGLRLALGADGEQIAGRVVRGGVGLTVVGVAIGAGVTLGLFGELDRLVQGGGSPDIIPVVLTVSVVLVVAVVASWAPARAAGTLDPVTALRRE